MTATNQILATAVPVVNILPISPLICESNRKKQWFPQSKSKMQLSIINQAPMPIC